mmetsp:Transcript_20816/g.62222  ORF Transcript_20816/g.62222 Transcript_20816/m.62222 type:complete len:228 (+) Transcript_20816:858-1541(+)
MSTAASTAAATASLRTRQPSSTATSTRSRQRLGAESMRCATCLRLARGRMRRLNAGCTSYRYLSRSCTARATGCGRSMRSTCASGCAKTAHRSARATSVWRSSTTPGTLSSWSSRHSSTALSSTRARLCLGARRRARLLMRCRVLRSRHTRLKCRGGRIVRAAALTVVAAGKARAGMQVQAASRPRATRSAASDAAEQTCAGYVVCKSYRQGRGCGQPPRLRLLMGP